MSYHQLWYGFDRETPDYVLCNCRDKILAAFYREVQLGFIVKRFKPVTAVSSLSLCRLLNLATHLAGIAS